MFPITCTEVPVILKKRRQLLFLFQSTTEKIKKNSKGKSRVKTFFESLMMPLVLIEDFLYSLFWCARESILKLKITVSKKTNKSENFKKKNMEIAAASFGKQ